MKEYVKFFGAILLLAGILLLPWLIYGDPRCIVANCRITH